MSLLLLPNLEIWSIRNKHEATYSLAGPHPFSFAPLALAASVYTASTILGLQGLPLPPHEHFMPFAVRFREIGASYKYPE